MIIGIGCDITEIKKFENKDESFIKWVLSDEELLLYQKKVGKQKAEFLAGRFCAKEAIIKAIPKNETMAMPEINIFYKNDKPQCMIDKYKIFISISHEDKYAISYVIIQKD